MTKQPIELDITEEEYTMLQDMAEHLNISIDELIEQVLREEMRRIMDVEI